MCDGESETGMINVERLCSEFEELASIASPSFREGTISTYLVERFRRLGAEVHIDNAGSMIGSETGNLVAFLPPEGKEGEPIMLAVHMDTVEPADDVRPVLKDGLYTSAGETVLGADDKSGIAEIIEAIEVMREQGIPRGPIEVVVTVCEEVGLLGAKAFDTTQIKSRRGLAFDTSGVDLVIHRAPAANKLSFEVTGREAHAGIFPEKGLSAIAVVSKAIASMQLGRIDEETTANIGTVRGGQATNIVPRHVIVEGEARSHDPAKLARQTAHMVSCFEEAARFYEKTIDGEPAKASVKADITADYPVMHVPADASIIELVGKAASNLGRTLDVRGAGGGSDANIFNGKGIETVIMGTGMHHVHSLEESVSVADMVRVTELLVEVLRLA